MKTKVTYLDHSGFLVETPEAILVFDYYRDPSHQVKKTLEAVPDKPVFFFVTHHHSDHFNPDIFDLAQNRRRTFVLSNDIESKHVIEKGMQVAWMSAGDAIEDLDGGLRVKAYGSTDAGVSYLVTTPEGETIFHGGDLNDWHWSKESTEKEIARAHGQFDKIVNRIASEVPEVNIAMFAVDPRQGEDYQRGAREFLTKVKVADFFPMHFWGADSQACDFALYAPAETATKFHCLSKPGESAEV